MASPRNACGPRRTPASEGRSGWLRRISPGGAHTRQRLASAGMGLLAWLGSISPGSAAGQVAPPATLAEPWDTWCVHAGGPLAGPPLVDLRGRIYMATSAGHLHSFERSGRYRWSFTVEGAIAGAMAFHPEKGTLWVGTTARRVYSISHAGQLSWLHQTASPVLTGLFRAADGSLLYGAADQHIYAVTSQGGSRFRVPLGAFATTGPIQDDRSTVWVPAGRELLRLEGAWRQRRVGLDGHVLRPPIAINGGVAVMVGQELVAFDAEGELRWRRQGVLFASADQGESLLVITPGGELSWLDQATGNAQGEVWRLPAAPAAPPLVAWGGVYVPLRSGALAVLVDRKSQPELWPAGSEPLRSLSADETGRRLLVASGGGRVCSLPLRRGAAAAS